MKKRSVPIGILAAIIAIGGIVFAFWNGGTGGNYTPDDVTVPRAALGFGEEATLALGESANYIGDVSITVTDFIYSPCPEGAQCIWEGLAVIYELRVGDAVYPSSQTGATPTGALYRVVVQDSDYQTYATLTVEEK